MNRHWYNQHFWYAYLLRIFIALWHFNETQLGNMHDIHSRQKWSLLALIDNPIHEDVIKWKHFPHYLPFVRGIHWSSVNSHHKGQWCGALMIFFICALNKWLSKQLWGWWFETPSHSLWPHCNVLPFFTFHWKNLGSKITCLLIFLISRRSFVTRWSILFSERCTKNPLHLLLGPQLSLPQGTVSQRVYEFTIESFENSLCCN